MLELELLEIVKPNNEVVELIGTRLVELNDGSIKHIKKTNINHIMPVEYKVKINDEMILINEYKGRFKGDRSFHIPKLNKTYTLREIKQFLKERN